MPCSMALRAASSAPTWAANGVDLRDPLKPTVPPDDDATVLPATSVIVTMVLLNVAWIWATPVWMFLRTRFLARFALAAAAVVAAMSSRYLVGFFLLATVRRGPFRVRALLRVRCP